MRTTSSVQFYCRNCKQDKQGLSPIEVSININGKRTIFHLPRKSSPKDFTKQIKSKKSELSEYLDLIRTNINNAQTELLKKGIAITAERLKEYIRSGGIKTYTVNDLINEFLSEIKDSSINSETYKKYQVVFARFVKYYGGEKEANTITSGTMTNFYKVLNSENVEATTGGKMTKMKTLLRWAWENGKINTFPMSGIKINKGKPKKEYLSEANVRKLKAKTITIPRLQHVKDLFIFQMSTGLSYADINTITTLLEKDGVFYITGYRTKTKIPYTAVVLQDGVDIWNKYNGQLPILTNQKYNAYLKEIQDICGITHNLTTHLARKTYATNMLNAGIAITTVSKMLGHSNCNITQKHYASVLDDTVISEFKKAM